MVVVFYYVDWCAKSDSHKSSPTAYRNFRNKITYRVTRAGQHEPFGIATK
jgi:hypothetical protein